MHHNAGAMRKLRSVCASALSYQNSRCLAKENRAQTKTGKTAQIHSIGCFASPTLRLIYKGLLSYSRRQFELRGRDKFGRCSIIFDKRDKLSDFRFAFLRANPYEKGSTLYGKNLLPQRANSFLLGLIPFQK